MGTVQNRQVYLSVTVNVKLDDTVSAFLREFYQATMFNTIAIAHNMGQVPFTINDLVVLDRAELSYITQLKSRGLKSFLLVDNRPQPANWDTYQKLGAIGYVGYVPSDEVKSLRQALYDILIMQQSSVPPATL